MHTDLSIITESGPVTAAQNRPQILMQAARYGQKFWCRDRDLPRLMRKQCTARPSANRDWLSCEERRLNHARLARMPQYDMKRHVLVMIALQAELSHIARKC